MSPVRFHNDRNMKHQNELGQLLNFKAVQSVHLNSKMFKKYQINCNNRYFQSWEEIFDPTINQLEVAKVINIGASLILNLVHTLQEERAN